MRSLTNRVLSGLLGAGLVLAASATPARAADPDVTAPVGRYQLDFTKIWDGQSATLTALEVSDDVSAPAGIRQFVDWGDGGFTYLDGDKTSERHQFYNPGSYTVTVHLTDRAGNSAAGTFAGSATVVVTRMPGTYKLAKKEVYIGDPVVVRLAGIPGDVTKVRIWWGDGKETTVGRTATQVKHDYTSQTNWYVRVMLTNAAGEAYGQEIGPVYTPYDEISPQISLTRPKKPAYVSSWRTVGGKVSDRGRGAVAVGAAFVQQRGGSWYYYTGKKWIKARSLDHAVSKTRTVETRPTSKKAWKIKIKGLKKGTLYVFYAAVDKDGNQSEAKVKKQKLTR